ncbi:adenosylcobalamin-dependent ribonucleoside-diphosphate reductase [Arenibaculum pallidiluteum]|uniref:adenosylcobalamin-dependent ribonucleoside-diphosphate reductase n=1 Tax=Arenibaculum pallidiluteum TaxID=2812559 RepID=UPI001A9566C7|nr:adenosylcobalamin-dependent ribonucleoside-diphosphate reductase [Arenibaculum pallidiluteum]
MQPLAAISTQIWDMKYRLKGLDGVPVDGTVEDTWRRVARALAVVEADPPAWEERFMEALRDFAFLPAGRILAGAGTRRAVTLFNCFVMGRIDDSLDGIFHHLREAALTMQQGGGIGYDFSPIRPKGAPVLGVGADASGPVSFMDVWDAMCRTIQSAGARRGAMMATLRCDHPDIELFVDAKREPGRLRMFNLSVLVTDAFMEAVKQDAAWPLVHGGHTYRTVRARELWDRIMRATYAYAEPGVIFIDRINQLNNLHYCETIEATNPCGEQPLPPYGACLLGSVNLAALVLDPFTEKARLDMARLETLVPLAVRMMDNVVDVSRFPLPEQQAEARAKRRIGLGVTGLADALILCRARYGTEAAVALTETWLGAIRRTAYRASIDLAREKGAFPLFDAEPFLESANLRTLEPELREDIRSHGIRNALLTSIAPTGTISLFADNISSGIEPVFAYRYTRTVLMPDGTRREEEVTDHAYRLFRASFGEDAPLPDYFIDAQGLDPSAHLVMQAVAQRYVDSSISKTINCPEDLSFEAFKDVYAQAYELGCKGCTTYRPNPVTGSVLAVKADGPGERATAQPAGSEPLESEPAGAATAAVAATAAGRDAESSVVYMTQPLDRPEALPGETYKLRWPESDHALYITLNDIVEGGRRRPFEVFINSKNMEHYAWTVALTRMISAVFRRGGDVSFVVDELKAVFDPRGGQWVGGRYVPSLLAAIGQVIERHMRAIGFLPGGEGDAQAEPLRQAVAAGTPDAAAAAAAGGPAPAAGSARIPQCPKCGQATLRRQEGCDLCLNCGYSKCG